tara:strand:+ start:450 stop:665 length:216 start_codon:yes stop_codon:yes gene_type:complete
MISWMMIRLINIDVILRILISEIAHPLAHHLDFTTPHTLLIPSGVLMTVDTIHEHTQFGEGLAAGLLGRAR